MTFSEQIHELTENTLIREFCSFALSDVEKGQLPDYTKINLPSAPKLVPNIYVVDFRDGVEKGTFIKFSGTKIDKHFGQNIQGKYLEDTYTGDYKSEVLFELYKTCYEGKKPVFASRVVHYDEGKDNARYKLSTLVFFPCSSNGGDVDYGLGMVCYTNSEKSVPSVYMQLEI